MDRFAIVRGRKTLKSGRQGGTSPSRTRKSRSWNFGDHFASAPTYSAARQHLNSCLAIGVCRSRTHNRRRWISALVRASVVLGNFLTSKLLRYAKELLGVSSFHHMVVGTVITGTPHPLENRLAGSTAHPRVRGNRACFPSFARHLWRWRPQTAEQGPYSASMRRGDILRGCNSPGFRLYPPAASQYPDSRSFYGSEQQEKTIAPSVVERPRTGPCTLRPTATSALAAIGMLRTANSSDRWATFGLHVFQMSI